MKVKILRIIIVFICIVNLSGCKSEEIILHEDGFESVRLNNKIGIAREPVPMDYKDDFRVLDELPISTNGEITIHDLRRSDLTQLDLYKELEYLQTSCFDDFTIWPITEKLPQEFDIEKIKEYGKNPGLNIRNIHKEGITGKGVGIAIIDQNTLVDHIEYKANLKHYEEIHMFPNASAYMHGPMVDSIAVGKTVGVAPGADLYHFSTGTIEIDENKIKTDLQWFSVAVDRVIEINKLLESENKIRVISFSHGITDRMKNYEMALSAIERAKKENIETIYVSDSGNHKVSGLGRNIMDDPNLLKSYGINNYLKNLNSLGLYERIKADVFVPIDARCVASICGNDKYEFQYDGGASKIPPHVAGLYALCLEINPEINIDNFYEALDVTSSKVKFEDGNTYKIANPQNLVKYIKKEITNSGGNNER